ncbi:MAG: hypothetical protein WCK49_02115, partial [Myxococcaceae bacterium]
MRSLFIILIFCTGSLNAGKQIHTVFPGFLSVYRTIEYLLGGGGKKKKPQAPESPSPNYEIIPADGTCNDCFFCVLRGFGFAPHGREEILTNLFQQIRGLESPYDLRWVIMMDEIAAAELAGEYRIPPHIDRFNLIAVVEDYLQVMRLRQGNHYRMIGFTQNAQGLIDLIADYLGIEIQIFERNARNGNLTLMRTTLPLGPEEQLVGQRPVVQMLYHRGQQHFEGIRFRHQEPLAEPPITQGRQDDQLMEALWDLGFESSRDHTVLAIENRLKQPFDPFDRFNTILCLDLAKNIRAGLYVPQENVGLWGSVNRYLSFYKRDIGINHFPCSLGLVDLIAELGFFDISIKNGRSGKLIRQTVPLSNHNNGCEFRRRFNLVYNPDKQQLEPVVNDSDELYNRFAVIGTGECISEADIVVTENSKESLNSNIIILFALLEAAIQYQESRAENPTNAARVRSNLSESRPEFLRDLSHGTGNINHRNLINFYLGLSMVEERMQISKDDNPISEARRFMELNFAIPVWMSKDYFRGTREESRRLVEWARSRHGEFQKFFEKDSEFLETYQLSPLDSTSEKQKKEFNLRLVLTRLAAKKAVEEKYMKRSEKPSSLACDTVLEHQN